MQGLFLKHMTILIVCLIIDIQNITQSSIMTDIILVFNIESMPLWKKNLVIFWTDIYPLL